MRLTSTYCFDCHKCGKHIETPDATVKCSCGLVITVEWRTPAKVEAPKVTPIDKRRAA